MKVAMLSPIAWRTPQVDYGARERVTSLLTEELVSLGVKVTLFATGNSISKGSLRSVSPAGYKEDSSINPGVWESLHISMLIEEAEKFDLIHNQFDFLPLTYSGSIHTPMLTTIHGLCPETTLPVFKKYNDKTYYVSTSDSDRHPDLNYIKTVHNGVDINSFTFRQDPEDYLLYFGRIHHDKGTKEAIEIAGRAGKKLIIAGIIQDQLYFDREVKPRLNKSDVIYVGTVRPDKLGELLGGARALLHPVNVEEPFALSAIESMACGTPVIAFKRGSIEEIVNHEKSGFLVSSVEEAVDAVKRVGAIDRAYCRKHAQENFTTRKMAESYLAVYKEILEKREDHRPWGYYRVLADEPGHKLKRIVVHPGKRLSLQRHQRRDEHWYVLEGEAIITLDEKKIRCKAGESVNIPKRAKHRVENQGSADLVFIEVQTGDYFGEDDIERIEDDFGRSKG